MIADSGLPSTHSVTRTLPAALDDLRDDEVGVAVVRRGVLALGVRLKAVVELLLHPGPQLLDQRLDVETRAQHREHPGEASQLVQVGDQRRARRPGTAA